MRDDKKPCSVVAALIANASGVRVTIASIVLKSTVEHIASSAFWRLFALVGKRLIAIGKTFSTLPFPFTPILYVLHCLRAVLRLVNYFRKTQNKNLGETRKFLFSAFKVAIAIVAFALCFFMPIPLVLGTAFLLYSVIKLVDSSGVLIFSFFAHLKLDKNLPENKWRRDQYWDNIIKHLSILGIGVAMTLLTSIVLLGAVEKIVWTSPVIILSLAVASVVTVVGIFYLGALFYQRYQCRHDPNLKAEYDTNIKKFAGLFIVWLLVLASVSVPFFLPSALALGFVAGFLSACNLYDSVKSIYDYFDKTKVADPTPDNLEPKNSLEENGAWCYYGTGFIPYLKTFSSNLNTSSVSTLVETNHIYLIKEVLIYVKALENKLSQFSFEQAKRENKIEYTLFGLAETLKNNGKNDEKYFIDIVKKGILALDKDCEKLSGKPLSLKTLNNINNNNELKKEFSGFMAYKQYNPHKSTEKKPDCRENNSFLKLFSFYNGSNLDNSEQPPNSFHQSFFRHTAKATLLWKAFEECQTIQMN